MFSRLGAGLTGFRKKEPPRNYYSVEWGGLNGGQRYGTLYSSTGRVLDRRVSVSSELTKDEIDRFLRHTYALQSELQIAHLGAVDAIPG